MFDLDIQKKNYSWKIQIKLTAYKFPGSQICEVG